MRLLVTTLFIIISIRAFTQHDLSGSPTGSIFKYIYKITQKEAITLYKSNLDKASEKSLHSLVDSFPAISNQLPSLNPGNYLTVYARGNRFYYDLKTVGDLEYKLVNNNGHLVIALHNRKGQPIIDADVYAGKKKIYFDPLTQTYRANNRNKSGAILALRNDVAYFFPIQKQELYPYSANIGLVQRIKNSFPLKYIFNLINKLSGNQNNHYNNYFYNITDHEKNFKGFMVFNKPIYKPGDTVKLKAYVMNKKGRPIHERLILRLTDRNFNPDTIIAAIAPYNKGGYQYELVLSDSLNLDLDKDYLITLEEERSRKYDINKYEGDLDDNEYASKRKAVMRGKLRVEDYELKSINFSARSDTKVHSRGMPVSLFMKATDENELAAMDGRVQILVQPVSYSSKAFLAPNVFMPDTLWYHEMALDAIGETKVELPDSIFPKASFGYVIKCTFLNTNNEIKTQTLYQSFRGEKYSIIVKQEKDSLLIEHFLNGKLQTVNAKIYSFNNHNDTLEAGQLVVPRKVIINPFAASYTIKTDSAKERFDVHQTAGMVSATAFRTKDSISVQLTNPYHFKVWYTIVAGKKMVRKGYGDSLLFIDKVRTKRTISYRFNIFSRIEFAMKITQCPSRISF